MSKSGEGVDIYHFKPDIKTQVPFPNSLHGFI